MGGFNAFGQRMLYDAQQRFVRSGLPVYLRIKNYDEENPGDGTNTDYLEVGVPYAPSGTTEVGTLDILIEPPPGVEDVSLHNIGLLAGRLNFGSKIFYVSHTFVLNQMQSFKITDPYAVWRDRDGKKVIGIMYMDRLFSIEDPRPRASGGELVSWRLVCNALEGMSSAPVGG